MSIIKTKHLSYHYIRHDEEGNVEGEVPAVKDVNLSVEPGEFIAILGHNGSGKSTLAKHFNALLLPSEGCIVAMHPKCIVLDEPTAMLDPNGRKDVIRAARALNDVENVTIILITHYMEEVIYADRVFVMDEGKVVMQGTPREIFSQVERLKHLRLDVPQVTLLAYELQKSGLKLPDGILTAQELTEELKKLCTGSKTGASDNRQMPVK